MLMPEQAAETRDELRAEIRLLAKGNLTMQDPGRALIDKLEIHDKALRAQVEALREALEKIEDNALSWHRDDAAKGRALAVIAREARAARKVSGAGQGQPKSAGTESAPEELP